MKSNKKILLVAGEVSGDLYGATLAHELFKRNPALEISGVGGPQMRNAGVNILYDSSSWGTIGVVEALKKAPQLLLTLFSLKRYLCSNRPDLIVCIDYPGFNMQLVRCANSLNIPVAYYVPPAKWATEPSQVRDAAERIDKVIATYPSTADVYKKAGADVEFAGHPVMDIVKVKEPREAIINKIGLDPARKIIGLLPGSREMEMHYLLPLLLKVARRMRDREPDLQFVLPLVSSTLSIPHFNEGRIRDLIRRSGVPIKLVINSTYEAMSVMDLAVVASGTATLELACLMVPMIIVYKISKITELVARSISNLPPFFGLPNIILDRRAVPELLQAEVTSGHITELAMNLLEDEETYRKQKEDLGQVVSLLGQKGAIGRVANIVLSMAGEETAHPEEGEKLGLIAGNGRFPFIMADEILDKGYDLHIVAIKEEAEPKLNDRYSAISWMNIGQIDDIINEFKINGIKKVVMAGKIHKTLMYLSFKKDERLIRLLERIENRSDDSILTAFTEELAQEGITVLECPPFLSKLMPDRGVLTRTHPDSDDWKDIRFGYDLAKRIGGLDIGQTVVVKDQAVLAVEAIEGTDEAILRGARLGKGDIVVAKVSKPFQDMRFDVPVVGTTTVDILKKAGAKILVIDAYKTILLDKEQVINDADECGISIVAL